MHEVERLRERARRCLEIARDYAPSVGAPLYELAAQYEQRASHIERFGEERRIGFH